MPLPRRQARFAVGDPGSLVNVAGAGIRGNAGNAEQAERFVGFLRSEEAQPSFAEEASEYPLVEAAPPPPTCRPWPGSASPTST